MDPMRTTMIKQRDSKQSVMRRGSIAYDPQCMLYHPNRQLRQSDLSPIHTPSVFSQILVKHYIETSPSNEELVTEDKYWWTSKQMTRKKFVLPWNHPLTVAKPHSPRHAKGSPSTTPQKGSTNELTIQEPETISEPHASTKRRNRYCCCMLRQKEDTDQVLDPFVPDIPPQVQEVSIRKREGNLSLKTVESIERVRSQPSEDRGMGSFIEDLIRSQAHSVSSLSWKTDSSAH